MARPAISPYQFCGFRIMFGAVLSGYFVLKLLFDEFRPESVTPTISAALLSPNPFFNSTQASLVYVAGATCGLALMLGWQRRLVSTLSALCWLATIGPYVAWMHLNTVCIAVIFCTLIMIPQGEPMAFRGMAKETWSVPNAIQRWAFPALLASYFLFAVIEISADFGPGMAREGYVDQNDSFASWSSYFIGILVVFAVVMPMSRRWVWALLLLGHCIPKMWLAAEPETPLLLVAFILAFDGRWLVAKALGGAPAIVYFDGVCGLCNRAVDFIIAEDYDRQFVFASIQSQTAQALNSPVINEGQSMVLQVGHELHYRSHAVLRIAMGLGGPWRLFGWLRYLPSPFLDMLYHVVQRNRYRLFGQRSTCRLPSPEEAELFLP